MTFALLVLCLWLLPAVLTVNAAASPGTVVAWGHNAYGATAVPAGLSGVTAIAAGQYHTVALKSDGSVVAWGVQSGNNEYFGQTSVPAGLSGVTAIAAGGSHSVALKSDGTVVAWGAGTTNSGFAREFGQSIVPAGLSGVMAIAAGSYHTVALKSNGTLVAWGRNAEGQTTIPAGLTNVTAIAGGYDHTVALKSDSTVVAWGANPYGATTVPVGLSGVTAVAASFFHSVALKSDGTVVAWGASNVNFNYGQATVPAGLTNVSAIAAGNGHTMALKSDGTVVAWGGQGTYNFGQTNVPAGLSGVTTIAAGWYHSVALVGTGTPTPTPSPGKLLNISTRLRVLGGDNVLIGGFIVTGSDPKKVIIRAIGPSLADFGIQGFLDDPIIELHDGTGATIASNDNWKTKPDGTSQQAEIVATMAAPRNDLESAIVATLPANNAGYTVILRGKNGGTGIGLVEAYDLAEGANSKLANISTRGFVDVGNNVMIGGFILGGATGTNTVVIRAIGFSLGNAGITGALDDPTLELHNGNGTLMAANDNWRDTDANLIQAAGLAPLDRFESSIISLLAPGNYTAIVGGKGDTKGVALVEVYDLGKAPVVSAQTTIQQVTGAGTSFSVATLGPALTYQWQRLPFGATQWVNVVDGGAYTGVTTNKLTLTETTTAASGDQFRVVITNSAGSVTSSPETFVANSLLKNAIPFTGIYPAMANVTYRTKAGDVLTIAAYPGLVQIFVDPATPEATVANAVVANAGAIVEKIPLLGLYIVQIAAGNESNFLGAIYANAFVIDGTALAPAVRGADIFAMDYSDPDPRGPADACWQLHGPLVKQILQRSGRSVAMMDVTEYTSMRIGSELLHRLEVAEIFQERVVVAMSIQSWESGSVASNLDLTGCSDKKCRAIRHEQILFYYDQLAAIETVALKRPDRTANAIVVIIAGNAGIDLDNELAALRDRFPNAFKSVKIVGGVDEAGHIIKSFNHLSDNSSNLMTYSRGKNVKIGMETCDGTSYAGPEVARVLDYISSRTPGSTVAQVLSAFDQALREVSAQNILPQDVNGLTTQSFLDRAIALATPATPLTGTWIGTWAWSGPGSNGCQFSDGGSFSMTLTQTGSSFSGSTNGAGIETRDNATCALISTDPGTGTASGSISGTTLNLAFDLSVGSGALTFTGTATLNNNTLTASFVRSTGGSGSFTVTRQ